MEDGNVRATLDMLAGLGFTVRVMRETPFLAVVENPAIPLRRVASPPRTGTGPPGAPCSKPIQTPAATGRTGIPRPSPATTRGRRSPACAGHGRPASARSGTPPGPPGPNSPAGRDRGLRDQRIRPAAPRARAPGDMTPRTARALARAPGVTIDDPYDAKAMRIPENGPTVRQTGTSDPVRRA